MNTHVGFFLSGSLAIMAMAIPYQPMWRYVWIDGDPSTYLDSSDPGLRVQTCADSAVWRTVLNLATDMGEPIMGMAVPGGRRSEAKRANPFPGLCLTLSPGQRKLQFIWIGVIILILVGRLM